MGGGRPPSTTRMMAIEPRCCTGAPGTHIRKSPVVTYMLLADTPEKGLLPTIAAASARAGDSDARKRPAVAMSSAELGKGSCCCSDVGAASWGRGSAQATRPAGLGPTNGRREALGRRELQGPPRSAMSEAISRAVFGWERPTQSHPDT